MSRMRLGISSDQELSGVSMAMRSGLGGMMPKGRTGNAAMRRSSNEVMRDAKYGDAGQDQQKHCASYAAEQTIAREMTAHGSRLPNRPISQLLRACLVPLSGPATDLNSA